jgi:hypothetical protein
MFQKVDSGRFLKRGKVFRVFKKVGILKCLSRVLPLDGKCMIIKSGK